jgi:AraC-like DNA-binding protein
VFLVWAAANFDDAFRPSWRWWLPTVAMAGLTVWAIAANRWLPWRAVNLAGLVLVGAGSWQLLGGRSGDLVEGRRRLRLILGIGAGLSITAFTVLAVISEPTIRAYGGFVSAAIVLMLGIIAAMSALSVRPEAASTLKPAGGTDLESVHAVAAAPIAIDPEERALLDRLRRLMEEERIYRQEGLGIAALAGRLGLPEYRLRRLINQRLGHRNFNSYVNGYRLGEAVAALADPSQARVPILTIALDAGFQSLGPFNRAFKAQTGVTPSEFRRDRLGETLEPPGQVAAPPADAPISKSASF